MRELADIKDSMDQITRMTTAVLDLTVDIVDVNLIRIAGKGKFESRIGEQVKVGKIFRQTMEKKRGITIVDPLVDENCRNCENLNFCGRYIRLYEPIIANGKVLGALSIHASSEKQNIEIRDNVDRYREHIRLMSEFLSLKVKEYDSVLQQKYDLDLQKKLMDVIYEGVMILDGNRRILYMNDSAEYALGCNMQQIPYLSEHHMFTIQQQSSGIGSKKVYKVRVRDKTYIISGKTSTIDSGDGTAFHIVFIFSDVRNEQGINQSIKDRVRLEDFAGSSERIKKLIGNCRRASFQDRVIVLQGEAGTGKRRLAQAIFNEGLSKNGKFIEISGDVTLISLLECQQSAPIMRAPGDMLSGNAIYIDEMASLNWEDQGRLIHIIQNSAQFDTQVICSTKYSLKELMDKGDVDPDLFYAVEMFTIGVPPLRERIEDVRILGEEFLETANEETGRKIELSPALWRLMEDYVWYGNTKELKNFIRHIVEKAPLEQGRINSDQIPSFLLHKLKSDKPDNFNLADNEKRLIIRAMNDLKPKGYSNKQIADALGIGIATLYRKLDFYHIETKTIFK